MKLLSIISLAAIAILSTNCSSAKSPKANKGEQEIVQLCNYTTDETTFYANGVAESTDMQMAKDKAAESARAQLSATLKVAIESFTKRYRYEVNDVLEQKTEDRLQLLTVSTLQNSSVCCERVVKTENGKYRAYVSVALPKNVVVESLKRLAEKELRLSLDERQKAFDKIAEEEIAKAGY